MSKIANLVIGPAGVGKSTFCKVMYEACYEKGRNVHCVNFDPAAESFPYPASIDIKSYITSDIFMESDSLGPNGALVKAMEHFVEEYAEVFQEEIGDFTDDHLWIDCPGQIELYVHLDVFSTFVELLRNLNYKVCVVFILDSTYSLEPNKFIAGVFACLSVMTRFDKVPCIAVVTKMDIYQEMCKERKWDEDQIDQFLDCDTGYLCGKLEKEPLNSKFISLAKGLLRFIDDEDFISFAPLNIKKPESVHKLLYEIDLVTEYLEDKEPDGKNLGEEDDGNDKDEDYEYQ